MEGPVTAATLAGAGADTCTPTPQRRLRQADLEFTLLAVLFQPGWPCTCSSRWLRCG
ncbi:MAG: hypothetical protein ACR2K2_10835 [Mycobacteriales bacterium]